MKKFIVQVSVPVTIGLPVKAANMKQAITAAEKIRLGSHIKEVEGSSSVLKMGAPEVTSVFEDD